MTEREIRLVASLVIVELEEALVPAHRDGHHLVVQLGPSVYRHDVRRSIEFFEFDLERTIRQVTALLRELASATER